jgi:shikimate dehydrogenase
MNNKLNTTDSYNIPLNTQTLFLLSTSGSQSSIEKHNKALQSLGANIVYFTFGREITSQAYSDLLKSPIVRGGAVTGQGLKSGVIPFIDKIDELAKSTGAVNTVININGKLHGYNTDAFGFESALRKHFDISGIKIKKAIIYGNGGVSGVAAHVLKNLGIEVTMSGRNQERVDKKMRDLRLTNFDGPYDLVVNATPSSSSRLEEATGFLDALKDCKMVFDHNMPEKDAKKNYLQEYCDSNDIYFIPGKDMYIPQMIKQWKLFLDGVDNNGNPLTITEDDIAKFWELNLKK